MATEPGCTAKETKSRFECYHSMDVDEPDPDDVRETVTSSPVDDALDELDSIFTRYEETITLEIAEDTYADIAQGVDNLYSMTCYTGDDLEYYKRNLPGTVFSRLPEDYDAYDLVNGDATLHLKFDQSHEDRYSIDTPYRAVDLTVPTTDAYFKQFYDTVQSRMGEYEQDSDSLDTDDLFK